MRRSVLLSFSLGVCLLAGCVLPKSDPGLAGRSAYWYQHTDPAAFFARERSHGRVYFLGVFDPERGQESPVPGISRRDPGYSVSRTWFVPEEQFLNPKRSAAYDAAVRRFAERYNPLVLAYLREHPAAK